MDNINERLNAQYGWSSGRKVTGGAPARGLGRSKINNDVLAWVPGTNVAIRMTEENTTWFYRVMSWPGFDAAWMKCRYIGSGILPEANNINDLIKWASTKKFQGLNIID